jgi:hypothetical protein
MTFAFPPQDALQDILFGSSLRHIATGGEHVVYISDRISGAVLKISSNTLRFILRRDEPIDKPSDETLRSIRQEELIERGDRSARLRNYFDGHTLDERRFLVPIPLTRELLVTALDGRPSYALDLATLLAKLSDGVLATTWAVVTIQPYIAALHQPAIGGGVLSLVGGYSDDGVKADGLDPALYSRVTHALVFSGDPLPNFSRLEFLRVQTRPELAVLVRALERDPALRATVRSLLEHVHRYVKDTGEILDTAGPGNILLIRDDASWYYLLIDALSIHNEPVLDLSRASIAKLINGHDITGRERLFLMKALNFLRTINGVGACIDLASDLMLSPRALPFGTIDCLRETRRLVPR